MAEGDLSFKVVVVGESGVGKTSIVNQFSGDTEQVSTGGQEDGIRNIEVRKKNVRLQIIDTVAKENIEDFLPRVLKEAQGILVVYDVTHKPSFESLPDWLEIINELVEVGAAVLIIGNKTDLKDKRVVTRKTLEEFAVKHGLCFKEVSGKTGSNIQETFDLLIISMDEIRLEQQDASSNRRGAHCSLL